MSLPEPAIFRLFSFFLVIDLVGTDLKPVVEVAFLSV
jgi:hypothetical protein